MNWQYKRLMFTQKITYSQIIPPIEKLWGLFHAHFSNQRNGVNPRTLSQAVALSWCSVSAYEGCKLVGFGRVLSDGILHAIICDLIVAPSYQCNEIKNQIYKELRKKCEGAHIPNIEIIEPDANEPVPLIDNHS